MRAVLQKWVDLAENVPVLSFARRLALKTFETSTHQVKKKRGGGEGVVDMIGGAGRIEHNRGIHYQGHILELKST